MWNLASAKPARALAFLRTGLRQLASSCAFSSDTNKAFRHLCQWVLNHVCILTSLDATPRDVIATERLAAAGAFETAAVLLQSESQHIQSLASAAMANLLALKSPAKGPALPRGPSRRLRLPRTLHALLLLLRLFRKRCGSRHHFYYFYHDYCCYYYDYYHYYD